MNNKIEKAEILCVGTELLLGDIVNTNAAFLSQRLADLGIGVYRHTVVGDNPERLKKALCAAFEYSDLVITSGGLGPTYDDLTKETVADFFGRKMYRNSDTLEFIKDYFSRTGRIMTKNNEKQAMIPEGAVIFKNNYGTAPALALSDEESGKTVIMLPGPPGELIPLFNESVEPYLRNRRESVIVSRNIHIFGIGESAVEDMIKDIMVSSVNPTVAPYCKEGEVRLRVTAKASDEKTAFSMCDSMISAISAAGLEKYIYGIDAGSLENAVVSFLHREKRTLCTAESCTGGLIAKRITDIPGCSDVFLGGCVTYTNDVKSKLVGVNPETLKKYTAVSEQVAAEMAEGARLATGADIGISTTGIAGPGGGSAEIPVGTVYVGISTAKYSHVRKLSLSPMRSREYIRFVAASNALDLVLKLDKNCL